MTNASDASFGAAIASLDVPSLLIGHRVISAGDEAALKPEEIPAFSSSVLPVRRASGAARMVARDMLARIGFDDCVLAKGPSGAPIWPPGVVGSLSHDSHIALAAVALRRDVMALGVDVEPAEPLPAEILHIIATPNERHRIADDPFSGRLLFSAKEAVYKAICPLIDRFLDFHDVDVSISDRKATVRSGHVVELRYCISTHLAVIAFLPR
jgi:4'-phosphopantetheinyl transferase EntD